MSKANKTQVVLNPLTGEFDTVNFLEQGITVRKTIKRNMVIPSDYYHLHYNPKIAEGTTIIVEEDADFVVLEAKGFENE